MSYLPLLVLVRRRRRHRLPLLNSNHRRILGIFPLNTLSAGQTDNEAGNLEHLLVSVC